MLADWAQACSQGAAKTATIARNTNLTSPPRAGAHLNLTNTKCAYATPRRSPGWLRLRLGSTPSVTATRRRRTIGTRQPSRTTCTAGYTLTQTTKGWVRASCDGPFHGENIVPVQPIGGERSGTAHPPRSRVGERKPAVLAFIGGDCGPKPASNHLRASSSDSARKGEKQPIAPAPPEQRLGWRCPGVRAHAAHRFHRFARGSRRSPVSPSPAPIAVAA